MVTRRKSLPAVGKLSSQALPKVTLPLGNYDPVPALKEMNVPFPLEYSRARDDFYAFMLDVREASGLTSSHQTYTMVQGVFRAFRRRLALKDAIRFSNALPVGLRALFVDQWDVDEPLRDFADDTALLEEVRSLREKHNFSPDHALEAVVRSLWKHVDRVRFENMLAQLPDPAQAFWRR